MITGRQLREARALLKWGQWRLAKAAHIPIKTLIRAESVDGAAPVTAIQAQRLVNVLVEAGIELLPENGEGPGVILRKEQSVDRSDGPM